MWTLAALLVLGGTQTDSPYRGEQQRAIKALSADDIAGYLAGQGMGFAKAAELNHYPGPRHVLDLAQRLDLTDAQRQRVQASFDRMHAEAVRLGRSVVDAEAKLEGLFREGRVDAASLDQAVAEIARLRGQLRVAHLRAHLETRAALTAEQVRRYDKLRGYGGGPHEHKHHHGGH